MAAASSSFRKALSKNLVEGILYRVQKVLGPEKLKELEDPNFLQNQKYLKMMYDTVKEFDREINQPLELPKITQPKRKGTRRYQRKTEYFSTKESNKKFLEDQQKSKQQKLDKKSRTIKKK